MRRDGHSVKLQPKLSLRLALEQFLTWEIGRPITTRRDKSAIGLCDYLSSHDCLSETLRKRIIKYVYTWYTANPPKEGDILHPLTLPQAGIVTFERKVLATKILKEFNEV